MFQKIKEKNIQHLIIDLRENGGGNNDNIPELFSFMAYKPFLHLKRAEMNAGSFTYLRHFKKPDAFTNSCNFSGVLYNSVNGCSEPPLTSF